MAGNGLFVGKSGEITRFSNQSAGFCSWLDQCQFEATAYLREEVRVLREQRFLGRVVAKAGATPNYIVSDKGRQFDCHAFRGWCNRRGIQPRYASTGSLRATAVVERFIRSLKDEWLRRIAVPLSGEAMRRELALYAIWHETHRPHQGLDGGTPLEVYQGRRQKIPAPAAVDRSRSVSMVVHFLEGRKELPIVELKQAA